MHWERLVVPAAAVASGLGASAWLIYLDYRRRRPSQERPSSPPRLGELSVGIGLMAVGLALLWVSGGKRGWSAVACYLPALTGLALVAIHVTRGLSRGFDGDGGGDRRDDP